MGVVYKRKDSPHWWLAYKKGNKRVREGSGTKSITLAREILRRREAESLLAGQTYFKYGKKKIEDFTLEYLEWIKTNRRPHTLRSYNTILVTFNTYLKKTGIDSLENITPKLLEDFKQYRLSVSKTCTVKNNIIVLKAFFKKAVEWGYLSSNPAENLRPVEITDSKPIRFLSEDEYTRFMEVCKNEYPEFYPMFYMFIHTGLRKSELLNLEWIDIDLKNGFIHIRSKNGFRPKGIDKKTGKAKERIIPMHDGLKKVLQTIPREEERVFKAYDKHRPRRVLIKISKKAGIDGLTRLHELRHSYATFLLNKGVDIYKIKELLGHSDIRDTMKYAHLPTIYMKKDVKQLEDLDKA